MDLLFETYSFNIYILSIIVALLGVIGIYFKYSLTYWSRRNVPHIPPEFPFGNTKDIYLVKRSLGDCLQSFYTDIRSRGHRFGGFYLLTDPQLIIVDPELMKTILTKDFSYFSDRGVKINEEKEPLTAHLIFLAEPKWKILRQKLTPTFTSGKVKMMFQTMLACADTLEDVIDDCVKHKKDIDIKEILGRFTTDIIGSCAFGLDCNSFQNINSEFIKYFKNLFAPTTFQSYKRAFSQIFPKLFYFLQFRVFEEDVNAFFMKLVADTIDYREKNNIKRNDFLQLLINIKNTGDVDAKTNGSTNKEKGLVNGQGLTLGEIAAQCFIFFIAGFETSSSAMSLFLYDMSLNQDIQDKVRKEIDDELKKYDGKLTYEGIMELKYLEQALSESMRLHPVTPYLQRRCTKDYKIPESDVIIEKETTIIIPVNGLHSDPEYYPDPTKFDPERFSNEEQAKRRPFTYLPFGGGPRICIGQRFGLLQTKMGLVVLLKKYRFSLSKRTQLPLKDDPKTKLLSIAGQIWLNAERV